MYKIGLSSSTYIVAPQSTEFRPDAGIETIEERIPLEIDALTLVSDHARRAERERYVIRVTSSKGE